MSYDVARIRKDFPILDRELRPGVPLVYLDNAATSQKPAQVLDAMRDYYEQSNANVHRGIHTLAEEATALYEGGRDKVARFINAGDVREVVFTKNSTEALNLMARTLPLGPGDEVVVTEMEHHSNLVPWQLACARTGATLKWIGLTDDGRLDLDDLDRVITERTKVVAFVHQSNLLGTVNPVDVVAAKARSVGARTVLDCSQSVPHMGVDVQALGVDAIAFTAHKMCGPTGIGVLWGRLDLLDELPPFLGGGEMIDEVTMAGSTWAQLPHKFEAGTPPIAEAVGLGAAVDYLTELGMPAIRAHEHELTVYALEALQAVDGLRIIGPTTADERGGAISFALEGIHPHDVGQLLDERGVAVRVGHHCARPACLRYGVPATTRASVHLYSTTAEIDALVSGLDHVKRFFER
ncbi:MAG: cysteine desulfurase / selenocysteine lyase [Frankiaceae bacterium]|nr:cysteine desulfurase / selenocysteine lyase [Frankiaceae bacterium]